MPVAFARRNKYSAIRTTIDGITFDSKREATRYGELKLLERICEISHLEIHPLFSLKVNDVHIAYYEADFKYQTKDGEVIEDVKGVWTPLARRNVRHFQIQYGKKVMIVK